jgi:predicted P-loop ATPase
VEVAGQAAQTAARDRPFHPVRAYLKGLRWDGVKRVDRWLTTYLGAAETEYSRAVGSRWLISAVARIFRPGSKADCCLILEGTQGIRKSTALRTLAGEYFTDELADLGSKDAAMQTRGAWIIELSELDSLSHSEVSRIKAFMSRTTDRFRLPYGMPWWNHRASASSPAPSITARICATRRVAAVSGRRPVATSMWKPWPVIGTSSGRKRKRGSRLAASGGWTLPN